jgi:hypothetical protein
MKKVTISFIAAIVMVMFTSIAFAGPIDWTFDKMGYTPTTSFVQVKQDLEKANAEIAKANALVAKANANFIEANKTIVAQNKTINYGGGVLIAALGGLAFLKRKDIAKWLPTKKNPNSPALA